MKYSEFEKLMEDKGFYIEPDSRDVLVCGEDDLIVISISKLRTLALNTDYTTLTMLDEDLRRYIAQISMELAFTNLEDREEEEEKYYYKLKGFFNQNYLKVDSQYNTPVVGNENNSNLFKTQLTDKEFETLPEDVKAHNWEKIKVERED